MAVGDLVVLPYQYEFRNFLFGSGTSYIVESVDGLLALPDVRTNDDERQDDFGHHAGIDLISGRRLLFELAITGAAGADIESKLRAANNAFRVSKRTGFTEFQLVTQRPGREKVRLNCRARRMAFPSNYDTAKGRARGAAELFAVDPRYYSNVEFITNIDIASGATNAQGVVTMNGDFSDGTEPVIEITGPAVNPRIQNNSDAGRTIRMDLSLLSTETMIVDVNKKTIIIDGADRYDVLRNDNHWWSLLPGNNTIVYTRSSTSGISRLTVRRRDAYLTP